jgi:hypothetical protein
LNYLPTALRSDARIFIPKGSHERRKPTKATATSSH